MVKNKYDLHVPSYLYVIFKALKRLKYLSTKPCYFFSRPTSGVYLQ